MSAKTIFAAFKFQNLSSSVGIKTGQPSSFMIHKGGGRRSHILLETRHSQMKVYGLIFFDSLPLRMHCRKVYDQYKNSHTYLKILQKKFLKFMIWPSILIA